MTRPACAAECRAVLVTKFAEREVEANVSWAPPLLPSGYEQLGMTCPHGVRWYAEPSSEQRAKWAAL